VAVLPLWEAWKTEHGALPVDRRSVELASLALLGRRRRRYRCGGASSPGGRSGAGAGLGGGSGAGPPGSGAGPASLRFGAECAERLGDGDAQDRFLRRGLAIEGGGPEARAAPLYASARPPADRRW
jgi:hypothetical protein